jgi:thymidylate synthase
MKKADDSLPLYNITDFKLNDYKSQETIKAALSN